MVAQHNHELRIQRLETDVRAIYEMLGTIHSTQARHGARLDGIEARMSGVEERLGAVEIRLDGLDGRLSAVEVRLDSMDSRLGAVEVRLDSMDEKLDLILTRLPGGS